MVRTVGKCKCHEIISAIDKNNYHSTNTNILYVLQQNTENVQ